MLVTPLLSYSTKFPKSKSKCNWFTLLLLLLLRWISCDFALLQKNWKSKNVHNLYTPKPDLCLFVNEWAVTYSETKIRMITEHQNDDCDAHKIWNSDNFVIAIWVSNEMSAKK